ncbi:outer membrane protein assembly factor BamA [Tistrella bauzanensis]|uniref:Outer membrane protein assembly factor BamA n=1 Tax=Tistrella bauzanensis TaxID=657419 RepID=A0ABQ1I9L9_9PROT|nr:outer membrane protein assembly factor BamA [Tistrella bauzanensis]GGB30460.1 outer membrane protein assembly factor BamA [Tistrella bauzanensis]
MPRSWLAMTLTATLLASTAIAHAQAPVAPQAASARIDRIEVNGNQRIEAETIRSYLALRAGDPADPALIDDSLKTLYGTGLFADVALRVQGGTLIVDVVENPVINRIDFEGNRRLEDSDLEREVLLRPRTVYTRTRVSQDVERLQEVYRRNGRYGARIDPKIIQLDQNRVDLVFEIEEGPRTEVRKISFVGNDRFSDGALRDVVLTTEARWYNFFTSNDTYDPDRLNYDRELLRRFYLKNGYADFTVQSAVAELAPDGEEFFVTFVVDEGERYKIGSVDVETTLPGLDTSTLQDLVQLEAEDWYDASKVETTVEALTTEVTDRGFPFVRVEPAVTRDRATQTINVAYQIDEGPRSFVERIEINGNARTLDEVIRREFRLAEGDPFNAERVRVSRDRLRNLDYFDKVEVTTEPGSDPDKTVVKVDVAEKSTGEISFGVGYSTGSGPLGDIGIRERNLLGRGQDLRVGFTLSGEEQLVDLSFTEPYFLNRDVAAGFDIFRREIDREDESNYVQKTTGGALRADYWLTPSLRHGLKYTLRNDEVTDVGENASRFIREQEGERLSSIVSQTFTYDKRDSRIDPRSGYLLRFTQDLAGLGGDARYARHRAEAGWYYPITDDVVGSLSGQVGYIVGLGDDVPINDRFFLGGDSLRGFATAGVGPRDSVADDALGGNLLYAGSVELGFPLGLPDDYDVRGRVFSDFGTVTEIDDSGSEIQDVNSIRASVGVGLTWISPFGPIRLDAAQAVLKEDFDDTEVFRFSFGTRF